MSRLASRHPVTRPSRRLLVLGVVGTAVAAGVLVAGSPAAVAAPNRAVTATFASSSGVTSGSVGVTGTLTNSPVGTTVALQRKVGATWTTVQTAVTTSAATYAANVPLPATTGTFSFRGYVPAAGTLTTAASATSTVTVRTPVTVTLTPSASTVPAGSPVTLSGTVSPFVAGATVALYQASGSAFVKLASTTLTSSGAYAFAVTAAGTATSTGYRVSSPTNGTFAAAVSPTVPVVTTLSAVTVTLTASSRGVSTGNAVTLSGTVRPFVTGNSVSLKSVTGGTEQTVASLKLSSTGAFTTTATPTATTTYRAKVGARPGYAAAASPDVTVTVGPQVVIRRALPAGTVGTAYTGRLTTQGNPAGTWSVKPATGLAPLTLDPATGVISGTPTQPGDTTVKISFTVTASGLRDTASFTVHVDPVPTPPATAPAVVSAGGSHTCRVQSDRTLWCWGFNIHGQLGYPVDLRMPFQTRPRQVGTAANWLSVSAGSFYDTCGVRTDYSLWCWGWNSNGEVGNGTTSEQSTPVQIGTDQHWRSVAVGDFHSCGLTTAGAVWCWGDNSNGQAGLGPLAGPTVPTQVGTATDWTSLSASAYNTCGLRAGGSLWCWGTDYQGQLGNGTTGSGAAVPTRVGTGTGWTSVDVGGATVCGTQTGGTLWCWGLNRTGSVGDGSTTDRSTPQPVGVGATWASVSAGEQISCGVRVDGTAWCWGNGTDGAVGDGTTGTNRLVPTATVGAVTWTSVSAGGGQVCAVAAADGSQSCWGANTWGQVGIGTQSSAVAVPTRVVG